MIRRMKIRNSYRNLVPVQPYAANVSRRVFTTFNFDNTGIEIHSHTSLTKLIISNNCFGFASNDKKDNNTQKNKKQNNFHNLSPKIKQHNQTLKTETLGALLKAPQTPEQIENSRSQHQAP